ncbi:MAG: AhpD family alkylhydroperoxidase [Methylophilaceae bacterium]|jgi:AhpD family alkylhydroperoxidase
MLKSYSDLGKATTNSSETDKKTKELIAMVSGVAARCDGSIGFHTQALGRLAATKQEAVEALGMAVYMRVAFHLMYAAEAIAAFAAGGSKSTPINKVNIKAGPLKTRMQT